jgi:hypothetical protein
MQSPDVPEGAALREWSDKLDSSGTGFATACDFTMTPLGANSSQHYSSQPHCNSHVDPLWPELYSLLGDSTGSCGLNTPISQADNMDLLPQLICGDATRNMQYNSSSLANSSNSDASRQGTPDFTRNWLSLDDNCHRDLMDKLQLQQVPSILPAGLFIMW